MSPLVGTIVIFALLFLGVYLSDKIHINMGLLCLIFALFLGCFVLKLTANQVFARFPVNIVMQFILGPFFFGYVGRAKVFDKLSQNVVYAMRSVPALFPFAVFLAAAILTACGGQLVTGFVIGSFAYSIAKKMKMNPLLIAVALWAGCFVFPWLDTTGVARGLIYDFDPALADRGLIPLMIAGIPQRLGFLVIIFFLCKGYKVDLSEVEFKKAEPYTKLEKQVLTIVCGFIVLAAVPSIVQAFLPNPVTAWMVNYMGIYVLFAIGILIFNAMHIEKADVVLKEDVPWSLIVLLVGTSLLMGLLNDVGTIDMITETVTNMDVSAGLLMAIICFCGGLLTVFSNGMVAAQTLAPIVSAVSVASGTAYLPLFSALYTGTNGPNISPFSGLGASALVMCDKETSERVSKQLFICSFGVLAWQTLLAFFGVFSIGL